MIVLQQFSDRVPCSLTPASGTTASVRTTDGLRMVAVYFSGVTARNNNGQMLIRWGTDPDRADQTGQTGWSAMVPSQKPVPPFPSLSLRWDQGCGLPPTFEPRGPSGLPPPWAKSPGDPEFRHQGDCDGMGEADAISAASQPQCHLFYSPSPARTGIRRGSGARGGSIFPAVASVPRTDPLPILIAARFVWALRIWGGRPNPGSSADPAPNKRRPAANPNATPTRGRTHRRTPSWRFRNLPVPGISHPASAPPLAITTPPLHLVLVGGRGGQ